MAISQVDSTLEITGTGNITVPSCQLMIFTQAVHFTASGDPVSAVSIGGNALTIPAGGQIAVNVGATEEAGAVVAYIQNPPTGTQNLTWTAGGTAAIGPVQFVTFWTSGGSSIDFVDAGTDQEADFSGEALQIVLDSATSDLVVGMCGGWLGVPQPDGATNLGENQVNSMDGSIEQWTAGSGTTTLNVASGGGVVLKAFAAMSARETGGGGGGAVVESQMGLALMGGMGMGFRAPKRDDGRWTRGRGERLWRRAA